MQGQAGKDDLAEECQCDTGLSHKNKKLFFHRESTGADNLCDPGAEGHEEEQKGTVELPARDPELVGPLCSSPNWTFRPTVKWH